jgi:hypothetical protein
MRRFAAVLIANARRSAVVAVLPVGGLNFRNEGVEV